MKKNNKGFTLVELLAVIVVLAIIMVIATQQINKTINRSRAKSFNETMNIVVENARILFAEGGAEFVCGKADGLEVTNLEDSLDYNPKDYTVSCSGQTIKITAVDGGKFENVDTSLIEAANLDNADYRYCNKGEKNLASIVTTFDSVGQFSKGTCPTQ